MSASPRRLSPPSRDELVLLGATLLVGAAIALAFPLPASWTVLGLTALGGGLALALRRAPTPLPQIAPLLPGLVLLGALASLPVFLLTLPLGLGAGLLLVLWIALPDPGGLALEWSRLGLELTMVALAGALALLLAVGLSARPSLGAWVDLPFLALLGVVVLALLALSPRAPEAPSVPV